MALHTAADAADAAATALTKARQSISEALQAVHTTDSAIRSSSEDLRRARDTLTKFGVPEVTPTDLAARWRAIADWGKPKPSPSSNTVARKDDDPSGDNLGADIETVNCEDSSCRPVIAIGVHAAIVPARADTCGRRPTSPSPAQAPRCRSSRNTFRPL